jgi:hypothetical protein
MSKSGKVRRLRSLSMVAVARRSAAELLLAIARADRDSP